ncbi:uncharacterized protein AB675_5558 [Cyphellophora attinorum]|uniref:Uncharacterized protein n=1 Tax=Cyphellophora attinorum TaxID=1664694 RepID=A0A0N1P1L7_9EURO|nr:uncharacterized protein AB675_5558 [Phialophora attinorum]KPI42015.1 hypothetical protein AB675_5558 [Phialophora attinorum]
MSGSSRSRNDTSTHNIGNSTLDAIRECVDALHKIRKRNFLTYQRNTDKRMGKPKQNDLIKEQKKANAVTHDANCRLDAYTMHLRASLTSGTPSPWEMAKFEELYGVDYGTVLQHIHNPDFLQVTNHRATAMMELARSHNGLETFIDDIDRYQNNVARIAGPAQLANHELHHWASQIDLDSYSILPRRGSPGTPAKPRRNVMDFLKITTGTQSQQREAARLAKLDAG